jgi:hypothetical protein
MTSAARWVGTYRFHFDPEMERFWRQRLEAEVPDALARDAALAEIRSEAQGAEIEITTDLVVASRSRGQEFYRTSLTLDGDTGRFVKPNGANVALHLTGDEIVADEPDKPPMRFTKIAPENP